MKKKLSIVIVGLMLIICQLELAAQPIYPKLTYRTKSGILSYLNTITRDSMIMVGQYCGVGTKTAEGYDENIEGLFKLTGKYPALISVEYGFTANNNLPLINHYAIKHWNKGGLVTISWCADNPWTDGYSCWWRTIENKDKGLINLNQLLKNAPESKAKTAYREELLNVGKALKQLQDSGVMVLWRPFHEMNGPWFWWCVDDLKSPTNVKDFERLWKDMYETFTNDLGLKNLIWVYAANADGDGEKWTATVGAMFPGSRYVDIVGTDMYMNVPEYEDYDAIKKLDKPIVVCEFGPAQETYGKFDEREIIKAFRGKAGWFLQWCSWKDAKVAIKDNLYYNEMMHDPSAITLDKLR